MSIEVSTDTPVGTPTHAKFIFSCLSFWHTILRRSSVLSEGEVDLPASGITCLQRNTRDVNVVRATYRFLLLEGLLRLVSLFLVLLLQFSQSGIHTAKSREVSHGNSSTNQSVACKSTASDSLSRLHANQSQSLKKTSRDYIHGKEN